MFHTKKYCKSFFLLVLTGVVAVVVAEARKSVFVGKTVVFKDFNLIINCY
jgi:hypothetical protein